jgi:phosphoribosyl 1,2-cyclic phosphate phosphodiesterase
MKITFLGTGTSTGVPVLTCKCEVCRSLDFRDKTNITKLLDMIDLGKIGVLGTRINFVEFDEKVEIQKRIQTK